MSETPGDLEGQAARFAAQMNDLLAVTVSPHVSIIPCRIALADGQSVYFVGNKVPEEAPESALLSLRGDFIEVPTVPGLFVFAYWRFIPNSTGQFIKVDWSQFSLHCTNSKGGKVPFLRMEVDPTKTGWSRAHINVTAESMLLGHIYGLQGKPYRRVAQIHIPVGGYAYRPCLEDFLEFAIDDGLLPERDGWHEAVNKYRPEYHRKQLMSLVSKNPEAALEALKRGGHMGDPMTQS